MSGTGGTQSRCLRLQEPAEWFSTVGCAAFLPAGRELWPPLLLASTGGVVLT